MINIEVFEMGDLEALKPLQPADWTDVRPHYLSYTKSSSAFPFKVMQDQLMVAVGTYVVHEDTAWLAHIIVHTGFRKQGIGGLLTGELLNRIDRNIYKTVYLMATPMGEPVYARLGFVAETEQLFFNAGLLQPALVSKNVIPYEPAYLQALLEMDRFVSGENRAERLMLHLTDARICIEEGVMKGYFLPQMGEGLVVAIDHASGMQLMQQRLLSNSTAILPVDNVRAVQFLEDQGFKVFRKATRMRIGPYREYHPEYVYNRVSGQIG